MARRQPGARSAARPRPTTRPAARPPRRAPRAAACSRTIRPAGTPPLSSRSPRGRTRCSVPPSRRSPRGARGALPRPARAARPAGGTPPHRYAPPLAAGRSSAPLPAKVKLRAHRPSSTGALGSAGSGNGMTLPKRTVAGRIPSLTIEICISCCLPTSRRLNARRPCPASLRAAGALIEDARQRALAAEVERELVGALVGAVLHGGLEACQRTAAGCPA